MNEECIPGHGCDCMCDECREYALGPAPTPQPDAHDPLSTEALARLEEAARERERLREFMSAWCVGEVGIAIDLLDDGNTPTARAALVSVIEQTRAVLAQPDEAEGA